MESLKEEFGTQTEEVIDLDFKDKYLVVLSERDKLVGENKYLMKKI